jgi:F0F1-type ATP synthase membrane subunit c/vacuolar-type H+-ATPase subunit K
MLIEQGIAVIAGANGIARQEDNRKTRSKMVPLWISFAYSG